MSGLAGSWRALAERVVTEYREALGGDLVAIAIFGSAARGAATAASDLDLYVVTRAPLDLVERRLERLWKVAQTPEYRRLVAEGYCRPDPRPVYHTLEELRRHPWILADIADHGIIMFDPDRVLSAELDAVRGRLRQLGAKRIERPDGTWMWDLKPDWKPGDVVEL